MLAIICSYLERHAVTNIGICSLLNFLHHTLCKIETLIGGKLMQVVVLHGNQFKLFLFITYLCVKNTKVR